MTRLGCARFPFGRRILVALIALSPLGLLGCGGADNSTGATTQVSPEFQKQTADMTKNMSKNYADAYKAAKKR